MGCFQSSHHPRVFDRAQQFYDSMSKGSWSSNSHKTRVGRSDEATQEQNVLSDEIGNEYLQEPQSRQLTSASLKSAIIQRSRCVHKRPLTDQCGKAKPSSKRLMGQTPLAESHVWRRKTNDSDKGRQLARHCLWPDASFLSS